MDVLVQLQDLLFDSVWRELGGGAFIPGLLVSNLITKHLD